MKLVNPSFLLALGTTLALVEAVPLRLLVVTNNPELAQGLRFGNAVQNVNCGRWSRFSPIPPSWLAQKGRESKLALHVSCVRCATRPSKFPMRLERP
ncbi:hypothetical protein F5887DRAFT_352543 [Amanita rubescens]|nr:hypothetical protein F5887DRAFT_352543 [Amanita rubescens]